MEKENQKNKNGTAETIIPKIILDKMEDKDQTPMNDNGTSETVVIPKVVIDEMEDKEPMSENGTSKTIIIPKMVIDEEEKECEMSKNGTSETIIPKIVIDEFNEENNGMSEKDEKTETIVNEPRIEITEIISNVAVTEEAPRKDEDKEEAVDVLTEHVEDENSEVKDLLVEDEPQSVVYSDATNNIQEEFETVKRDYVIKARPPLRSKFNASFSVRSEPSSPCSLPFNNLHKAEAQLSLNESLCRKRARSTAGAGTPESPKATKRVCQQPWFSWWGDGNDSGSKTSDATSARSCSIM